MQGKYVDMHVHSFYSDGSMSPEKILNEARKNQVGILAIADHDLLGGSLELMDLCRSSEITPIPAVEIDTLDEGKNFHILAYGFDFNDQVFLDFLKCTRFLLDESGLKLVEAMEKDYDNIKLSEFFEYTYDTKQGGWKALHYLKEKGVISSLKEGIGFYDRYGVSHDKYGYSTIRTACKRIRDAGGYAVLAHPGETMDTADINQFRSHLNRLARYGLDGIECYYPTHSDAVTKACIDVCDAQGLMITAGSDCHGSFGERSVGDMGITIDKVRLKSDLDRQTKFPL